MKRWIDRMLHRSTDAAPASVLSDDDRRALAAARSKLGPRLSRADEALRRALDDADAVLRGYRGPERRRHPR